MSSVESSAFLSAVAKHVGGLTSIPDVFTPDNDDADAVLAAVSPARAVSSSDDMPALRCVGKWNEIRDMPVVFGIGQGKYGSVARNELPWSKVFPAICGDVIFYYGEYSQERKAQMATLAPSNLSDWSVPPAEKDEQGKLRRPKNLKQERVVEVTSFVGDVDQNMTLPDVTRKLDELGVAYGVYASPSFTKAKPKFRIVVAMAPYKVASLEDRGVYAETYQRVMDALGITEFDRSCRDVNQYYYSAHFQMPKPWPFFHGAVAESEHERVRGRAALAAARESGDFVLFWKRGGYLNFNEIAEHVRQQRAERLDKHGTVHAPKREDGRKPTYIPSEKLHTKNVERFMFTCGRYFKIVDAAEHYEGTTGNWHDRDDSQGKGWVRCPNDHGEISGRPHSRPSFDHGNRKGYVLQNPRDGREATAYCKHGGCTQFFAKPDNPEQQERLIWLDLLCQRWGVTDAADLLAFCEPEADARKAFEGWSGEVGGRPAVNIGADFDVRKRIATEAMKADRRDDGSPYFYAGAEGTVSRLRAIQEAEDGGLKAELLGKDALASELNRIIDWRKSLRGSNTKNVSAPADVVRELGVSIWLGLPKLNGIVRAPFITADGEQVAAPGYHEGSGLYHNPVPGFTPIPIRAHEVTKDNAIAARDRLFDLLRDFPFTDRYDGSNEGPLYCEEVDDSGYPLANLARGRASRANALTMIIHPHVTPFFDGVSPMYGLDATLEGSGKGTLVDAVSLIAEGREAPKRKFHSDPEETSKDITAALIARARMYVADNAKKKVENEALEAALTSGFWSGRILGKSETIDMRMRMQFILTMNNGSYGRDMMRRVCPIRLQPSVVHSRERSFKRDDYAGHVLRHRAELIRDIQLIILYWISRGRPDGAARLNSFIPWSRTMSGILEAVDVPDLLGNLGAFYATDGKGGGGGPEGAFVADWYAKFGLEEVTATRLYDEFLDDVSGMPGPTSYVFRHQLEGFNPDTKTPTVSFGKALGLLVGRAFNVGDGVTVTVTRPSKPQGRTQGWQLERCE